MPEVTFISKWRKHRIVVSPSYYQMQGPVRVYVPGKTIEFDNYRFITDDDEVINRIRTSIDFKNGKITEFEDPEAAEQKLFEKLKAKYEDKDKLKEVFKCEECGKEYDTIHKLTGHMNGHKRREKIAEIKFKEVQDGNNP